MPQIADMPDAYTVRRSGRGTAEAIVSRSGAQWQVLYGFQPDVPYTAQWRASAFLPGDLDTAGAGRRAAELVDAYDSHVPGWHNLLAAAMRAGSAALAVVRLHRPEQPQPVDGAPEVLNGRALHWLCRAESFPGPLWLGCPTVQVIAGALGVVVPAHLVGR